MLDAGSGRSARRFNGTVEAGQRASYVLFVQRGPGEFGAVPVDDWYSFKKRASVSAGRRNVSLEEIEKHMKLQRRTDRCIVPKSSLIGEEDADGERTDRIAELEQRNESMDQGQYEKVHASDYGTAGEMAAAGLGNTDADVALDRSDDDGVVAPTEANEEEAVRARNEMKTIGLAADTAGDSALTEAGKSLNKLLHKHEGDESSSSESASESDDADDDDDDDDDDDADADVDDKLSGKKRKTLPDDEKPADGGDSRALQQAKRVRQSGVAVQPPASLNDDEMLRVVRESGALQLSELIAKYSGLLQNNEKNKGKFKLVLRELSSAGKLIFETVRWLLLSLLLRCFVLLGRSRHTARA